jgi:uracil-DNA glycosylase
MIDENVPYALNDQSEEKRRLGLLRQPCVKGLTEYCEEIKGELGRDDIPYFDPCDGGIRAKALFLLEAPGRKAKRSKFVSRNNPDQTAKNMCQLLQEAYLPRADTLLWNIVPWYVGTDRKIKPVGQTDIERAIPYLEKLLNLLPRLELIVLVGLKSQSALPKIKELTSLPIIATYHPSPRVFNRWPQKKKSVQAALREIANALAHEKGEISNIA